MLKKITLFFLANFLLINIYSQKEISSVKFKNDELLIWFNPQVNVFDFLDELSEYGIKPKKELSKDLNIWLFSYTKRGLETDDHFFKLRSNPNIRHAQNNHYVNFRASSPPLTPNDPSYSQQWGMNKIKMPDVWGNYLTSGPTVLGDNIVVAVVDDEFDLSHEDLQFWVNDLEIPNNLDDDDNNGYVDDYEGWDAYNSNGTPGTTSFFKAHATRVSGIIGAVGNNNTGISGVNWILT